MSKKVGIWTGASRVGEELWDAGLRRLEDLGIEAKIPKSTRKWARYQGKKGLSYLAGPDEAKIEALQELWEDPEVCDILCVRGGYGTLRLLPKLDKIKLPKAKKQIWGFSDYTIIQHYFFKRFKMAWVHSPMLSSEAFFAPTQIEKRFFENTAARHRSSAELAHRMSRVSDTSPVKKLPKAPLLLGGNLACLVALIGTPWEPTPRQSFVLFLEDLNEPPYKLDRLLRQLSASKFFKNCQAVLLGHFSNCGQGQEWKKTFQNWSLETMCPLYQGLKVGHDRPHVPLAMGRKIKLNIENLHKLDVVVPNLKLGC